jgi:polyhydroxybutyrate depolymerase
LDLTGTLTHDSLERTYRLHLPPDYDPSGDPVPLIVALHGRSSSGLTMALQTGLNDAADAAGYAVAYPDAHGYNWGEDTTLDPAEQIDDVGFITALIDMLAADYAIDAARVDLTGYHNGGLLAYRLACEVPDRFDSVAVVGPMMWQYQAESCPTDSSAAVNLLMVHGTDDALYWDDTRDLNIVFSEREYTVLGVQDTLDFWIARFECDLDSLASVNGVINARAYTGCADETQVALYSVINGRETWPRTGDYTLNQFGIDATTMIMQFFAGDGAWAQTQEPYTGQPRTYTLYVPSTYDPAEPTPVVMALHGRFGSGESTAQWIDMNRIAEENGFIAVYPDGLLNPNAEVWYDTGWNYMRGVPGLPEDEPNDAAFLADLLDDLSRDLNIDAARVYVVGISNGGFMAHHLACVDPQRYAAFADVMGSGYYAMETMCQHQTPTPMIMIHGTDDDNILWHGNAQESQGQLIYFTYPITSTFEFWGRHNGCDVEDIAVEDVPQQGNSPNSTVRILSYACPDNAETMLYGVIGGGHTWPGTADDLADAVENKINMDINAGEEIWAFFSRHSR